MPAKSPFQRGFTLPSAKTDSAKAARSAFFCSLCQKGYTRMNEFEAHESSYDHQHKKRLKDMKEMQRQAQPRGKEEKGPMITMKLGGAGKSAGGGFKKGGFKSAFGSVEDEVKKEDVDTVMPDVGKGETTTKADDSDLTDEDDYYDPRRPTGCGPSCKSHIVHVRGP